MRASEILARARKGQVRGEIQTGPGLVQDPEHYLALLAEEGAEALRERDEKIAKLESLLANEIAKNDRLEKRISNLILQARGRPMVTG
jgi:hypothetical protein